MNIHDRISAQLPEKRERMARLLNKYGSFKVSEVTVDQIYGGIRGVQIQVSDISYVDPYKGLHYRGYTVPETLDLLPKAAGSEYPMVGGLYYLLMTDQLPTLAEALEVEEQWKSLSQVPPHVFDAIRILPPGTHPMTLFSVAIMALQPEAVFPRHYTDGVTKPDYWKYYLDDALNLTAKLPTIAAYIYNLKYRAGRSVLPDPNLDWGGNFGHMIGKPDDKQYQDLSRLFLFLHADHEGANVSAHASHLVASALSDVYLSAAAGMNGLAGPLHGLANQECLRWLLNVRRSFRKFPTKEEVEAYVWDWLNSGQVVPGYGHAVLRCTDPRFTAQYEYAEKYCPDDELFRLVDLVFQVVPPILTQYGKVKNPWPNVDAINGALQYHYGVREFDFYTVLFGISRILGLTTHALWSRALMKPIERPKSLTTEMLESMIRNAGLMDAGA